MVSEAHPHFADTYKAEVLILVLLDYGLGGSRVPVVNVLP